MSETTAPSTSIGPIVTWPISEISILVANIFIPRIVMRLTSLLEGTQESDFQMFSQEFRGRLMEVVQNPASPVTISKDPLGPRSEKIWLRGEWQYWNPSEKAAMPPMSLEDLNRFLDLEEWRIETMLRGRLRNSGSFTPELVPLSFRPSGQRGERPLTRDSEQESWEEIRANRIPSSLSSSTATREPDLLNKTIWDPQIFLVAMPTDMLLEVLPHTRTLLQLDAVTVQESQGHASFTRIPYGALNQIGAQVDILSTLSLADLGFWPSKNNLANLVTATGEPLLPGQIAINQIFQALSDSSHGKEQATWWIPRLLP